MALWSNALGTVERIPEFDRRGHLHFDGAKLYFVDVEDNIFNEFSAVSGQPGTTAIDQGKAWRGPLPEGVYSLRRENIRFAPPTGIYGLFGDWGEAHAPIDMYLGSTLGRSGFHIHGGLTRGSAGCIDLGPSVTSFFNEIMSWYDGEPDTPVLIVVQYEHPAAFVWGDGPFHLAWRPPAGTPVWAEEQAKYQAYHNRDGTEGMQYRRVD